MRRSTKIDLGIFLGSLAFAAIGYEARIYLDRQFEILVPLTHVAVPGSMGGLIEEAVAGDRKESSSRKKETPEQKKSRLKKERTKSW